MDASVRIDPDDPTPPYEQLRRQLALLITSGTLTPDSRLAPVRRLAADLALATGTVARAYRELEAEGLVRTARGAGTRVSEPRRPLSVAQRRERLADLAQQYIAGARLVGAGDDEVRRALERALGSD